MYKTVAGCSVLIILVGIFLPDQTSDVIGNLLGSLLFYNTKFTEKSGVPLFTKDDLKLYNGVEKPQLYLAVLGKVYDVSRGHKHYGPNQQYNVFVGCDASRSFVTGKFNKEELSDDVVDLSKEELRSLNHWAKFYKSSYEQVGKVIGKYYKEDGKLTSYGSQVKKLIRAAELDKENEMEDMKKFPPCNIEWDAEKGTKLWCSNKSGGISRDWVGLPRQYYEVNSKSYRCACIKEDQVNSIGNIKKYEGCDIMSNVCFVKT
ncbi:unnamed protein product [Diabrotica balteata]|uniref:Cytochrome b5 heme-binding domain-containing protein n=1 Tax=Diabrotica balteata TaxID=107213 RepID=A0A9N9T0E1_DIABA|nr:unnamed protein product [Diabrotica balteata]